MHRRTSRGKKFFAALCACVTVDVTDFRLRGHRWNNALKEKKFEKVAALYSSKDLSFLPTVSPKFIQDSQSTQEYFLEFLKKLPEGTITADRVQNYGNDAYLHSGMYTFMVGPEDSRTAVEARFSYMWRKINGEWKITHHHSSALPGVAPRPAKVMSSDEFYPIAQVRHLMPV